MKLFTTLLSAGLLVGAAQVSATVSRDLPLPQGTPSADEIARQVYFANHFYAFKNFSIRQRGRTVAVLINRDSDGSASRTALERHLNNDYENDVINSSYLAIYRNRKIRGTVKLVTY